MSYEKEAGKPEKQAKARREFDEEMRKLERKEGGKVREDIRDADEEISKLREDENKEAEHLCWIVVTPFGVGEYCYGESWCSGEAQGWR